MRKNPRNKQNREHEHAHREIALTGRRKRNAAPNSLKFLVEVEGVEEYGYIRAANGARWRLP